MKYLFKNMLRRPKKFYSKQISFISHGSSQRYLPRICCSKEGKPEDASEMKEEILRLLLKFDSFDDILLLFQLNCFLGLAVIIGGNVVVTGILSHAVSEFDGAVGFSNSCLSFT